MRGIFVGKVGRFRDQPQLTHPEFVMLDATGAIVGSSEQKQLIATMSRSGLVGMYPATAKLPTWKVAECCRLALATLSAGEDPWPEWVLDAADVMPLVDAFAAVHGQGRQPRQGRAGAIRIGRAQPQPPAAAPGVSGLEQPFLRALASLPWFLSQAGSLKTSSILAFSNMDRLL